MNIELEYAAGPVARKPAKSDLGTTSDAEVDAKGPKRQPEADRPEGRRSCGPAEPKNSVSTAPRGAAAVAAPRLETVSTADRLRKMVARRWKLLAVAGGAAVVMVATLAVGSGGKPPRGTDGLETETVRRRPMRIVVTNRGTVDSAKNVVLTSEVLWPTKIIRLVPEGTWVEKGDIICELDSSMLQEKLKENQINVTRGEAAHQQAQKALELQKLANDRDISAAKLRVEIAQLDLEKFKQGEFPQQEKTLESQITLAREALTRAQANYEFMKRMSLKGYRSQQDVDQARIEVVKAEVALKSGQAKSDVLKKYTYERTETQLEATAVEMGRLLERVKIQCDMALLQAEAYLQATERTERIYRESLKRVEENIAACTIRAPQAGEVVYCNDSTRGSNDDDLIQEGANIHYQQAIVKLPNPTKMQVETRIHESQIQNIAVGQTATIGVDACTGRKFHGKVVSVSTVPVKGDWTQPDLKEFSAIVEITDPPEAVRDLKPGLTAEVEIEVERLAPVLQVPVNAVVEVAGEHMSYVMGKNGPVPRRVSVGKSDRYSVEILSGLEEGEQVVVSPRTYLADALAEYESQIAAQKPAHQPEAAPVAALDSSGTAIGD